MRKGSGKRECTCEGKVRGAGTRGERPLLILVELRNREMTGEGAGEAGAVDEELFTKSWDEVRHACDLRKEQRDREKGFIGKEGSVLTTGAVWELEGRGGAELRQSAPPPTPLMESFTTKNGNVKLGGVMDNKFQLVRQAE